MKSLMTLVVLVMIVLLLMMLVSGCGKPGVSAAQIERIKQEIRAEQLEQARLEQAAREELAAIRRKQAEDAWYYGRGVQGEVAAPPGSATYRLQNRGGPTTITVRPVTRQQGTR